MIHNHQLAGILELERWLEDLLQVGLAVALARDVAFWEEFAARMVNAKLGGIARRIRIFKTWLHTDDAHERLLCELGELYLFVKAFQQLETLPPDLQQEILTTAGATIKKEKVLQQEHIENQWLVIGQTEGKEDDIRFRRTWLQGVNTHQIALLLDFAFRFAPFEVNWIVGSLLQATVVYYPGAYLQRAIVKDFAIIHQAVELSAYADWEVFLRQSADALAQNPWLFSFAGLVENIVPVLQNEQFFLMDANYSTLRTPLPEGTIWKILAISGGHSIQLFGEWDHRIFTPLSIVAFDRIISI